SDAARSTLARSAPAREQVLSVRRSLSASFRDTSLRRAWMHRFRRLLHGGHDSRMRSATADISLQCLHNFRGAGSGIFLQQGHTAYDHSGSAIRALKRALIEKCLLHGMQLAVVFETFDGDDGFSRSVIHGKLAGSPRRAIQQDGARATMTFAAAVLVFS